MLSLKSNQIKFDIISNVSDANKKFNMGGTGHFMAKISYFFFQKVTRYFGILLSGNIVLAVLKVR